MVTPVIYCGRQEAKGCTEFCITSYGAQLNSHTPRPHTWAARECFIPISIDVKSPDDLFVHSCPFHLQEAHIGCSLRAGLPLRSFTMHGEHRNHMYGGICMLLWVADTKSRYFYLNDYEHDPQGHSNSLTHCLHNYDI